MTNQEQYELMAEAFEKQKPMQPIKKGVYQYCSRCANAPYIKNGFELPGKLVEVGRYDSKNKSYKFRRNYCFECGQAQNWEENE